MTTGRVVIVGGGGAGDDAAFGLSKKGRESSMDCGCASRRQCVHAALSERQPGDTRRASGEHALPLVGVGFIGAEVTASARKLTRIVRLFSRRFTVQERIGQEVADLLVRLLELHGVAVDIRAVHLCTQMRGARARHRTTFWRGNYDQDPQLRAEFLGIAQHRSE